MTTILCSACENDNHSYPIIMFDGCSLCINCFNEYINDGAGLHYFIKNKEKII